jgi:hypothetical protein
MLYATRLPDHSDEDVRTAFPDRYEIVIRDLDDLNQVLKDPKGALIAADVPVGADSDVTMTVLRRPTGLAASGGACGGGIAIHHGSCHWGIFIEVYCE